MQRRVFVRVGRRIQRQILLPDLHGVASALGTDIDAGGNLVVGRRPPQRLGQEAGLFLYLLQVVDLAHWRPRDLAVLGQRLENRLADPPDRIGDELEATRLVEPLDRLHQADVPFGNQLDERETIILVLAGNADHETQIGHDQFLFRLIVAGLGALEKFDLLFATQRLGILDIAPI